MQAIRHPGVEWQPYAACTLLDCGSRVDTCNAAGETALMYAAEAGQGEACMVLLERGATKRRQRKDGHIALTLAAAAGKVGKCV